MADYTQYELSIAQWTFESSATRDVHDVMVLEHIRPGHPICLVASSTMPVVVQQLLTIIDEHENAHEKGEL